MYLEKAPAHGVFKSLDPKLFSFIFLSIFFSFFFNLYFYPDIHVGSFLFIFFTQCPCPRRFGSVGARVVRTLGALAPHDPTYLIFPPKLVAFPLRWFWCQCAFYVPKFYFFKCANHGRIIFIIFLGFPKSYSKSTLLVYLSGTDSMYPGPRKSAIKIIATNNLLYWVFLLGSTWLTVRLSKDSHCLNTQRLTPADRNWWLLWFECHESSTVLHISSRINSEPTKRVVAQSGDSPVGRPKKMLWYLIRF